MAAIRSLRPWRENRKTVQRFLNDREWTQADLTHRLGLKSQSDVSRYLNGKLEWPQKHLETIAELMRVPVDVFYEVEDASEYRRGIEDCIKVLETALAELKRISP